MPRTIVPLTFGEGVDRATGKSSVPPSSFADLRNVYLEDARVRLRKGFQATGFPALPVGTDVRAIAMLEATLDIIFVLYERSTRAVTVYRLNPLTTPTMQNVGTWGTVAANATLPPMISVAESYGKLYLAHAEPVFAYRMVTKVYTPNATDATVGSLATLQADLNGDTTAADVYFRGVRAWNDSLIGYGYGEETSAASQDRPEIVRISKPADPSSFLPEAYFIAGKRSTPVTGLGEIPGVGLVVGKTTSCYLITGTDAETYGINRLDPDFGNLNDHTMLSVHGAVWMWSLHGPRVTTGGATVDVSGALGLDAPQPATLPAAGDIKHAFAFHDLASDTVEFGFPDLSSASSPTLFYVASVRDPSRLRWSYHVRDGCIGCASTVLLGKEDAPTLTAYTDFTAQADAGVDTAAPTTRKITMTWDNLGSYNGSESYEVWWKPAGGSWSLKTTVSHNNASTQTLVITGAQPLQDYSLAVRATRAGAFTSGYSGADPDAWVAGTAALSKTTVQTSAETPTMTAARWYRTPVSSTDYIELSFVRADSQVPFILEKSTDNSSWSTVATYASPSPVTPGTSSTVTYAASTGERETYLYFRLTPKRGSISGPSATGLYTYIGPTNAAYGFSVLTRGFERAAGIAHFVLDFNGSTFLSPVVVGTALLEIQFSTDNATWSPVTLPWSFQSYRRVQYYALSVALVQPGTNYFRWRSGVLISGPAIYTPWQSTSWAGSDATVTPSISWFDTNTQTVPSPYLNPDSDPISHNATLTTGQKHFVVCTTNTAGEYAYLFHEAYDAGVSQPQIMACALATLGLSQWPQPTTTFKYFRVDSSERAGGATQAYTVQYPDE